MRTFLWTAALVCLFGLFAVRMGYAAERPKVGVALGGGAAKGLAHIGVLKVLEEVGMPVDCITGVSMGSVVGGLYAMGCTTAELESLVVAMDWVEIFSDREPRRVLSMEQKRWDSRCITTLPMDGVRVRTPSGLTEGKNLIRLFSQLSLPLQRSGDFKNFPIPFACVATDIMTGEAVVLDKGFLSDAMRASMSIPTVFSPIRIDGRLLVDGGLARVLPAEDVRRLGADIVIGVDVGRREYTQEELNSFITISNQALNLVLGPSLEEQQRLCDILIQPDMEGVALSDFVSAGRIIKKGEEAARAMLPRLQALADSLNALSPPAPKPRAVPMDSIYLTDLSIEGLSGVPRNVIEKNIGVDCPRSVTVGELGQAVGRIRGTQLFERVSSRIEETENGARLVLELHEEKENALGIGLRYDTRRDASLLVNTTFRNVGLGGATIAVDAILREEFGIEAKFLFPLGLARSMGVKARADASRVFLGVFDDDTRVATYRASYYFGEMTMGGLFSTRVAVSGGVRGEYVDQVLDGGWAGFTNRQDALFPYFGMITFDTFDRTVYPRRGVYAQVLAEATDDKLGSDVSFSRFILDWRAIVPLSAKVSVIQNLYLGTTSGDEIPPAYHFFLGGVDEKITLLGKETSFYGLEHQERVGPHVQTFHLGVQWTALRENYVILVWNAGNTFDEWGSDLAENRYINGGGLTLGLDTLAGPVELTVMTSERHDFLTYFTAGYKF
jgi:NTE family protein